MRKILINNRGILEDLDKFATQILHHPSTFSYHPQPNITMARLKEVMDADDGSIELSNGVDYAGRHFNTNEYRYYPAKFTGKSFNVPVPCYSKYKFMEWLKHQTQNQAWEMDTWEIQPEYHGWTPWHSCKNKPINFVRFVWNSGSGFTNYVANGKHYKFKDSKYTGQKCWNCLVGKLDGSQYLSDRNVGAHKRLVIQFSLPSKYDRAWEEFIHILGQGNKTEITGTPGFKTTTVAMNKNYLSLQELNRYLEWEAS